MFLFDEKKIDPSKSRVDEAEYKSKTTSASGISSGIPISKNGRRDHQR
jgi:hypothetical protein